MVTLLFDIDGTLINSGGAGGGAMLHAFSLLFGVKEPQNVPFSGRTDRAIASDLFRLHGIEDSQESWHRFRQTYLEHLPQFLPRRQGRVLPGVSQLLDDMADHPRVSLGLLTGNIRDGARLKLEYYELFHHFAFGGFGDHHLDRSGVAHDALTATRDHLNGDVTVDRVWVIGDTPLDVTCARAIGAKVAAVATGIHDREELADEEPDLLLDDLADPQELLDALELAPSN